MSPVDSHQTGPAEFDPWDDGRPDAGELAEMAETWRRANRYHPTTHPTGEE